MAFRATNVVPANAYNLVKRAAVQLKINCQSFVTTLQTSGADYDFLRGIYLTLTRAREQFDTLKTTPGLAAYAQSQEDDPTYDVASEFVSMLAAIDAATAWMDANVPTNVTAKTPPNWDDSESMISDTFSTGATTGLRTQLDAVIAEII